MTELIQLPGLIPVVYRFMGYGSVLTGRPPMFIWELTSTRMHALYIWAGRELKSN